VSLALAMELQPYKLINWYHRMRNPAFVALSNWLLSVMSFSVVSTEARSFLVILRTQLTRVLFFISYTMCRSTSPPSSSRAPRLLAATLSLTA
jgi:hypothetical protein